MVGEIKLVRGDRYNVTYGLKVNFIGIYDGRNQDRKHVILRMVNGTPACYTFNSFGLDESQEPPLLNLNDLETVTLSESEREFLRRKLRGKLHA